MSGNAIFKSLFEIAAGVIDCAPGGPDAVQLRNFDEVGLFSIVNDLGRARSCAGAGARLRAGSSRPVGGSTAPCSKVAGISAKCN